MQIEIFEGQKLTLPINWLEILGDDSQRDAEKGICDSLNLKFKDQTKWSKF